MLNKTTRSFAANALATAIFLAFTATASADNDNDRNHVENHGSGHTENHGSGSDDNHSGSDSSRNNRSGSSSSSSGSDSSRNDRSGSSSSSSGSDSSRNDRSGGSSSGSKLKTYLTAVDQPSAQGEIKLEQKTSKTEFSAEVKIPVPSTALGVANATDAADATLNLVLRDSLGQDYAECSLDLKSIKTVSNRRSSTVASQAEYKVEISNRNGYLQEKIGVCDTDLTAAGIQSGIPQIQVGDSAEVSIDTNGAIVGRGSF